MPFIADLAISVGHVAGLVFLRVASLQHAHPAIVEGATDAICSRSLKDNVIGVVDSDTVNWATLCKLYRQSKTSSFYARMTNATRIAVRMAF